jgi:hypothetical protein
VEKNVVVEGTSTARFEPVRAALAAHLEAGEEVGASIAVDVDGVKSICGVATRTGRGRCRGSGTPW